MAVNPSPDTPELQRFVAQLGAAMTAAGQPVHQVQQRLQRIARVYGARSARISAFPTYFMVTMGTGNPVSLEITSPLSPLLRLDQVAALERLVADAERGAVDPNDGVERLATIRELPVRFGPVVGLAGYGMLAFGLCLILHPALRDVAAAAVFGVVVGILQLLARRRATFQILLPIVAAFTLSSLSALAIEQGLTGPGLPAMVAALIVFLPGVSLTNAVLELAAGQTVSGSSRLVGGAVQLALLAFGILAGIELVGVPTAHVFQGSTPTLGDWAPWVGVAVFSLGVHFAHSAPRRSLPSLVAILYAAWAAQVLGNEIAGAYVSAFIGAVVLTVVAAGVSRVPHAMPPDATFLPGFWLLVPGALGLIGLTKFAGDATSTGTDELIATTVTIFAIAVGVLCGALLLEATAASRRAVRRLPRSAEQRRAGGRMTSWLHRARTRRSQ
jgi:uncharacterized membrane protein YjjP (DUF1212 family)